MIFGTIPLINKTFPVDVNAYYYIQYAFPFKSDSNLIVIFLYILIIFCTGYKKINICNI